MGGKNLDVRKRPFIVLSQVCSPILLPREKGMQIIVNYWGKRNNIYIYTVYSTL